MHNFSYLANRSACQPCQCIAPSSCGFTLIEVLVTLALVSIGFMGVTGMQSFGLQQTHNTYFRTQADLMLRDMADRMRANPVAAHDGNYVITNEYNPGDAPQIDACDGADAACNNETMAAVDLAAWLGNVNKPQLLPNGQGFIEQIGPAGSYQITISWSEKQSRVNTADADDKVAACIDGVMKNKSCLALNVFIQ